MRDVPFILATWTLLSVVMSGLGLGLLRLTGVRSLHRPALLASLPIGYAATLAFLQAWNFILPVTAICLIPLTFTGLLGLTATRHVWRSMPRLGPRFIVSTLLWLIVLAWLAHRATGPSEWFDSGSYHWNFIAWSNAYPIMPGLANLHHRLGFNNSGLLFSAMLNTGPFAGRAGALSNGLIVGWLFLHGIVGMLATTSFRHTSTPKRRAAPAVAIASTALLIPAFTIAVSQEMSSPSTDAPAAMLVLLAMTHMTGLLLGRRPQQLHHASASAACVAAAVCVKLSSAFFAAGCVPLFLAWCLRQRRRAPIRRCQPAASIRARLTQCLAALTLGTLLATLCFGWIARGIILSGYAFFPSTLISLPVDWRVPESQARWISHVVREFARYKRVEPDAPFNRWDWTANLFQIMPWATTLYCLEAALALLLLGWFLAGPARKQAWIVVALWLPPLAALAGWFLLAPDPRFGWHLFWLPPLVSLAFLSRARIPRVAFVAAVLWPLPIIISVATVHDGWFSILFHLDHRTAHADHGTPSAPQPTAVHQVRLSQDVTITVADDSLIWAHPVPSTSLIEANAQLRDPHNIRNGFRHGNP